MGRRALICHHAGHLDTALRVAEALDREVTLLTPRGAAGYGGPAYFLALFRRAARARPAARARWLLDCDDDPALAIFALQCGWPGVLLRGHQPARARLAAIAAGCNAELLSRCPASLDLGAAADPEAACRRALGDV